MGFLLGVLQVYPSNLDKKKCGAGWGEVPQEGIKQLDHSFHSKDGSSGNS